MKAALVAIIFAVLVLHVLGKGSFGAVRGGSYRSYKSGYYSRRYYYNGYGYYGRTGLYTTRTHRTGARSGAKFPADSEMNDMQCARQVRFLSKVGDEVTINSTRYCYHQRANQPGDPKNALIQGLILDKYFFSLRLGNGAPLIRFTGFVDKDDPPQDKNYQFSLQFDTVKSGSQTIDLSRFSWTDTNSLQAIQFPSSKLVDSSKVVYYSVNGTSSSYPGVTVTINFQVADDFTEDGLQELYLIRPASVRVVTQVTGLTGADFQIAGTVAHPQNQKQWQRGAPLGRNGIEYDPTQENRLEYYTNAADDKDVGQLGVISWFSSFDPQNLCNQATESACVVAVVSDNGNACPPSKNCSGLVASQRDNAQNTDNSAIAYHSVTWSAPMLGTLPLGPKFALNLGIVDYSVQNATITLGASKSSEALLHLVIAIVLLLTVL